MQETIEITDDIRKAEEEKIRIEYYTLDNNTHDIYMCPGDLIIICNVIHDYAELLQEIAEEVKGHGVAVAVYNYHHDRCKKIQKIIEDAMGYSTEAAIEKCKKKRERDKKEDIREEALVLATRARRREEVKRNTEASKNVKKIIKLGGIHNQRF